MVHGVKLGGSAVRTGGGFSSLGKSHDFLRDLYMSFPVFLLRDPKKKGELLSTICLDRHSRLMSNSFILFRGRG